MTSRFTFPPPPPPPPPPNREVSDPTLDSLPSTHDHNYGFRGNRGAREGRSGRNRSYNYRQRAGSYNGKTGSYVEGQQHRRRYQTDQSTKLIQDPVPEVGQYGLGIQQTHPDQQGPGHSKSVRSTESAKSTAIESQVANIPNATLSMGLAPQMHWATHMYQAMLASGPYAQQAWPHSNIPAYTSPHGTTSVSLGALNQIHPTITQPRNPPEDGGALLSSGARHKRNIRSQDSAMAAPIAQQLKSNATVSQSRSEVPPAVPSFGFTLPTPLGKQSRSETSEPPIKRKRKYNQLGLTPRKEEREDSDENIDEEAAYTTAGGALSFVYKGQTATLRTPEDIAAWLKERKARYPTKARVAKKKKLEAEKAESLSAARRRLSDSRKNTKRSREGRANPSVEAEKRSQGGEQQRKLEREVKKMEKLRRKLQESETKVAKAAAQIGKSPSNDVENHIAHPKVSPTAISILGINYVSDESEEDTNGDSKGQNGDTIVSVNSSDIGSDGSSSTSSTPLSSSPSDSDSGSESLSASDSDATPAKESSKIERSFHVPSSRTQNRTQSVSQVCSRHMRTGDCPYGDRCKYSHPARKRKRLFERLVEQEEHEQDSLVLEAIKYLGSGGFLQ